ncbi:hypothetical protein GCM10009809_29260 [Isoptericola hypogeus]|uniref:Uncharacterized protein n=1 Tax=Isoptericola hypogeus TaxID=300179 RepID=A0ABN2JM90_9MICO
MIFTTQGRDGDMFHGRRRDGLGDVVRDDAHDDVHGMGDDARSDHDVGRSR